MAYLMLKILGTNYAYPWNAQSCEGLSDPHFGHPHLTDAMTSFAASKAEISKRVSIYKSSALVCDIQSTKLQPFVATPMGF